MISCTPARVSCIAALGGNEAGERIFCSGKLLAAVSPESPSAMPPKTSRLIKAKPGRCMVSSLLIRRHFGQFRREEAFLFFLGPRQCGGRDNLRGDEDDQVLFGVLFGVGAKRPANKRNIADDGDLIFSFLHVLAHQPTKHYRLPVINAHARGHLARAEHWLVYYVLGEKHWLGNRNSSSGSHAHRKNWTAVIDEPLKLNNLRN